MNALPHAWTSTVARAALALAITVAFAGLARLLRGVNRSGMLAGAIACFCLFVGGGPGAFINLAALFIITWIATRLGLGHKQELGLAEKHEGRTAIQVLANLAVPAIAALVFARSGNSVWLLAMTASLSEAATDTVASEIGQSFGGTPRMITNFRPVPAGTDGGITLWGTIGGMAASIVLAAIAAGCGLVPRSQVWIPICAGFIGMLADSVLGATLQRRGLLSNEGVNLAGTVIAAALAFAVAN